MVASKLLKVKFQRKNILFNVKEKLNFIGKSKKKED